MACCQLITRKPPTCIILGTDSVFILPAAVPQRQNLTPILTLTTAMEQMFRLERSSYIQSTICTRTSISSLTCSDVTSLAVCGHLLREMRWAMICVVKVRLRQSRSGAVDAAWTERDVRVRETVRVGLDFRANSVQSCHAGNNRALWWRDGYTERPVRKELLNYHLKIRRLSHRWKLLLRY